MNKRQIVSFYRKIIRWPKSQYFFKIILCILILTLIAECILLISKNIKLKNEIIILQKEMPFLSAGDYFFPNLELIDINKGEIEIIEFSNNKTLLYILTDSCVSCNDLNLIIMKRLSSEFRDKIRVFVVDASTKNYKVQSLMKSIRFSGLYVPLDISRFVKYFRLSNIPLTVFVNEECMIAFIKKGNLNSEDYLKIKKIIKKEA